MEKLFWERMILILQECPYLLKGERPVFILLGAHICLQVTAKQAHYLCRLVEFRNTRTPKPPWPNQGIIKRFGRLPCKSGHVIPIKQLIKGRVDSHSIQKTCNGRMLAPTGTSQI